MAVLFNDHADRLYRGSLPVANGGYTVCMWVKPRAGSGQHEFLFESDAAGTTYCLASNNGVLGILNAGGGFVYNVTLGAAMTEDVWYFVAMTINGTTGNLYRGTESSEVTNASGTIATQASSYRVYLGSDGSSSAYPCFADIAHVRVWDAVLSGAEIEAERQSATPARTANISADWRMVDAAGKLDDSSGQSRPLTAASTGPWADASDPSFGTTVTGTSAVTQGNATSAASGTHAIGGISAVTQTDATSVATGLLVPVGTSVVTQSDATSGASGAHGVAGTSAVTQTDATSAASGLLVPVGVSVVTQTDATSVASGTHPVTGTSTVTQSDAISDATGAVGAAGTSAVTQSDATSAASGVHSIVGTSVVTQTDATSVASGTVGADAVTGTSAVTQGDATSVATGLLVPVGTSVVTQTDATSVASGFAWVTGTSAVTQGDATSVASGTHSVTGTSTVTQGDATSTGVGYAGLVLRYVSPGEESTATGDEDAVATVVYESAACVVISTDSEAI